MSGCKYEVNLYVMGRYVGKRKVSSNSIIGALIEADFGKAMNGLRSLQSDINSITDKKEVDDDDAQPKASQE